MHGHSPGYTGYIVSVNVKLESMGRLVDGHVGLDAKTSPRQAVIEKAQAELRKEFHVRERRRRELEFLEKGGNLLDFRYASAATVGVQSTSLTDQLHEHEEKGSLALASSMQGDSNPCSEQPSAPSARESKIADNLVLDDENSTFNRGKNVKHLGKRKTTILLETASKTGEDYNINKSEENVILHLSMKSQAYARRNRSQSSCDIAHITSTEAVPSYHADQPSLPTFQPSTSGANVSPSAICNSKTASSYENSASKPIVSEDHLGLELDPVLPHEEPMDETGEPKETSEITTNKLQGSAGIEQRSQIAVEQYGNGVPPTSCGTIMLREENSLDSHTQGLNEMVIHPESSNKSKFSGSCNAAKDLNNIDKNSEKYYNNTGTSISISYILEAEHSSAKISHDIDDSATGACHLSVVPDGGYNRDFGKQTSISEPALLLASAALRENREISSVDVNVNDRATVSASNSISQVENKNLFDERTDRLAGTASTAHLKNTITDNETCLKAEAEMDDSSHYAYIASNKTTTSRAIKSDVMLLPNQMFLDQSFSVHDSEPAFEIQSVSADDSKLVDEVHEDLILKEAQIIEAKLKKAGELPHNFRIEKHRRSHWDYVLEEMTWLANDFMQERLWKITAAAQICHNIALNGHSKFHERIHCRKVKVLARTLGDAVMSFWQSAEENKVSHEENPERLLKLPVYRYAVHFLKSDSSSNHLTQAEAPRTPERMFDLVSQGIPWEVHFSEESMHYKVPDGSMQVYRESMEAYWLHHEKMENKMQQVNCEASVCDSAVEFRTYGNTLEEDEAETAMAYMPEIFEANRTSKFSHKKRKNLHQKSSADRPYEIVFDLPYNHNQISKMGVQPMVFIGKRPPSTVGIGLIPTKRVRTAARQRVVSPFNTNATEATQIVSKMDVSSCDTSSFQNEESSLLGVSQSRKNSELESTADFENQMTFDSTELHVGHKKKKKPKFMGYKSAVNSTDCGLFVTSRKGALYDQRWPADSHTQAEQKDHLKKRSENYHFGSNGSGGLNIHQAAKNPKLVKHVPEKSSEADPAYGPIPSPDTSQMSIMSNSNKLLKVIQRDRGRRNKSLKVTAGQSGTGTPWSLFEDQALVVLVHDMGPNWELISDAMNGTLQFKCIHRKPMDCKERHKFLMDISDGADSAEDSGSSQPYPSTLPGIPKGSARQLFQYLQGPLDEDTLKSHFEKIIHIGQNIHSRKIKKGNHNSKQVSVVHSSHVQAFSEACPNNLSGAPLTPIDLCDTIASSSDNTALQCQGPHINGSALSDHQGHSAPILPSSGANTVIQGSPGTVMGGSQSSPPAALSAPTRNVQRYGMPRPSSSPVDDQQTMQQFDQTLTSRNVHGTLPVGPDRNLRMLPRGNGMGMMGGVNRGVHMSRPGFQGVGSPAMLNMVSSGSMTSCTGVGIPGQVNIHSRSISSQGNSLVRPRDGLQMLGSGKNSEDHRQTIKQEIQMHGKQGNGQPTSSFNAMRAPLSSQPISQPGQSFSVLQQQQPQRMPQQPYVLGIPQHAQVQGSNHSMPQQQAYAMRVAQERQVQQRLLHQQEVSGSNAMSTMQNSPQIQKPLQSSTTPVSAPNPQQKSNASHNPQSSATLPNQIMKQRQRQQLLQQQLPRQQTQLPQQVQQHANLLKGAGRGSVSMDQSSPIETSHVNGPFPGNQVLEKHMMQQSKTSYPQNLGSNATLLPSNQQKKFPRPLLQSAKQMPTTSSHPNGSNQGNQVLVSQPLLASQQQSSPSNQSQKQTNQSHQKMFRVMLHQNCQLSSDNSKQAEPIQIHQNPAVQTIPHCTDSVGLIPDSTSASSSQWKSEPSFDGSVRTPSNQVFYSPQSSLTATESLVASASQGLMQRQFSGTILVHGQSTVDGSSWPHQKPSQQQPPPAQQQQQPPIQLQQLHRNVGQGAFYGRSTNNGPG